MSAAVDTSNLPRMLDVNVGQLPVPLYGLRRWIVPVWTCFVYGEWSMSM